MFDQSPNQMFPGLVVTWFLRQSALNPHVSFWWVLVEQRDSCYTDPTFRLRPVSIIPTVIDGCLLKYINASFRRFLDINVIQRYREFVPRNTRCSVFLRVVGVMTSTVFSAMLAPASNGKNSALTRCPCGPSVTTPSSCAREGGGATIAMPTSPPDPDGTTDSRTSVSAPSGRSPSVPSSFEFSHHSGALRRLLSEQQTHLLNLQISSSVHHLIALTGN